MGSLFGGGDTKSETKVELPDYIEKGGSEQYNLAKALQRQPYVPYAGPRIAPFTADENAAFGYARSGIGAWQPDLNASRSMIDYATQPWGESTYQNYVNPYQKNVTDIAAREVQRAYDTDTRKAANAAAVGAGAFGGARHGVVEAENLRNKNQAIGDIYAQGGASGYEAARQGWASDRNAALQGASQAAGLGQLTQGLGTQDTELLLRSGQYQRQLPQASLDLAYQDFQNQFLDPYKKSDYATRILQGVPYGQTTSGTGTQPPGSPFAQIGGLGLGAAGLAMVCERRFKRDIVDIGRTLAGAPLYLFRYIWSPQWVVGPMADEVERLKPWAIRRVGDIRMVDIAALGRG